MTFAPQPTIGVVIQEVQVVADIAFAVVSVVLLLSIGLRRFRQREKVTAVSGDHDLNSGLFNHCRLRHDCSGGWNPLTDPYEPYCSECDLQNCPDAREELNRVKSSVHK